MSTTDITPNLLFDNFSPYDIALLEFTSPAEITTDDINNTESPIILTSKASYLWAGAIAHMLINRPAFTEEDVFNRFSYAVREHAAELRAIYLGPAMPDNLLAQQQVGLNILNSFLQAAGLSEDAMGQVSRNTEEAVKRLQENGLIEDPLSKRIHKAWLSVILLIPINFTCTTENGNVVRTQIDSIAASVAIVQQGDQKEIQVKIKVQKAAKIIKEKLGPLFEEVIGDLAET